MIIAKYIQTKPDAEVVQNTKSSEDIPLLSVIKPVALHNRRYT